MSLETGLFILILLLAVFLIFAVPVLYQLYNSAKRASATLEALNRSLPLILTNLEEITTNMNKASRNVHDQVESLARAAERYQGIIGAIGGARGLFTVNTALSLLGKIGLIGAFLKGLKVFSDVFRSGKAS